MNKSIKKGTVACGQAQRAKPSFFLMRGGSPAARGRDNVGNPNPPPKYYNLEGYEAPGWAYYDPLPTVQKTLAVM